MILKLKRLCLAGILLEFAAAVAFSQESDPAKAREHERALDQIVAAEAKLGSDGWRAEMLGQSPRHHELVKISGGARTLEAFVIYPDVKAKVPVVLMIPEDQGLNNWARNMADEIAAMGYIVIVPDMLSGRGPNGGGRNSFPDSRSVIAAHSMLPANEGLMTADLNTWADYGQKLAQANGMLAVVGFAWGGGRAFWFATQRQDLSAAFIFYDAAPPAPALTGLKAPVYGFYATIDPRVTKSLETTKAAMAAAGKKYEAVIYPGSEHMFVRLGEEPGNTNPANIEARGRALVRLQELLGKM
jgi:carboxymethylenebutenolidase